MTRRRLPRLLAAVVAAGLLALLGGCASAPQANPADPLEPLNRSIYAFNDGVDRAVFKPVATAYRDVVPSPVRTGVHNFFNNLQDLWSAVNHTLQLNGEAAGHSIVRFGVNTVFGLGGLLDVATEMRIPRVTRDFGSTLGVWGVGSGPYLVLPLLGPSTLRDTAALPADHYGDASSHIDHVPTRNSTKALDLVDARAGLLEATGMLDQVTLDPYAFTRDAYLHRRRMMTGQDAEPPAPSDERYDDSPPPQSASQP